MNNKFTIVECFNTFIAFKIITTKQIRYKLQTIRWLVVDNGWLTAETVLICD